MAETSTIEWTDATWNPITGCSVVSPGCTNCYAMRLAGTRLQHHPSRTGLTQDSKAGPVWTGEVRLNEAWLDQPLRWHRPRMIFVCAHGDLFHESVPDEWIDRVMLRMMAAHWHVFQVLTKRAARMRRYMTDPEMPSRLLALCWSTIKQNGALPLCLKLNGWPLLGLDEPLALPNVWLGVSAEDQPRADERIPHLLATPAAVRWVSAEPLLGGIDVRPWLDRDFLTGCGDDDAAPDTTLDWIVAGGESGPGARPMHPDWARSLRDQCAAAGVPFHFKQWGAWCFGDFGVHGPRVWLNADGRTTNDIEDPFDQQWAPMLNLGKSRAGRLLDGIEHNGMPDA